MAQLKFQHPDGRVLTIDSPDGSMPTEQELDGLFKVAETTAVKTRAASPLSRGVRGVMATSPIESAKTMREAGQYIPSPAQDEGLISYLKRVKGTPELQQREEGIASEGVIPQFGDLMTAGLIAGGFNAPLNTLKMLAKFGTLEGLSEISGLNKGIQNIQNPTLRDLADIGKFAGQGALATQKWGLPITQKARGKLVGGLREGATKSYGKVLGAVTKGEKEAAGKLVPELTKRKPFVWTRGGLKNAAERKTVLANENLEAAYQALGENVKLEINPILDKISSAQNQLKVAGVLPPENARLNSSLDNIAGTIIEISKTDKTPLQAVRQYRQILDKAVKFGKKSYPTEMKNIKMEAQRRVANIIRNEIASQHPSVGRANAEFNFWQNLGDLLETTSARGKGFLSKVSVGVGTIAKDPVSGMFIRNLGSLFSDNVAWNSLSGKMKSTLADSLARNIKTGNMKGANKIILNTQKLIEKIKQKNTRLGERGSIPVTGEGKVGKPTKEFGFTNQGLYEQVIDFPMEEIPKRSITTPEYRNYDVNLKAGKKVTKPIIATIEDINNPNSPIEIVDGWHRYRQALINRDKTIPVKLIYEPKLSQPTGKR